MWKLADILDVNLTTSLMSSSHSLKGVDGVCICRVIMSRGLDLFMDCGMHRNKQGFEGKP